MVRYCRTCLFPETKPDLYFEESGKCDACVSAERIHGIVDGIDWKARAVEFDRILKEVKTEAQGWYDCIIPVSGGKDSTWQVYAMKMIHHMNPLAVTFDQFDQTRIGLENLEALRSIGVDHVHFTLNPKIVKRLVRKGFEIVGDPYWVNHVGMFTVPFHFASKFKIPLVIFGEQPQLEYGGPTKSRDNMLMDKRWRQEFGGMRGFREEDMVDEEILPEDLRILQYPSDEEIVSSKVKGLFYGHFFRWDASEHIEVARKVGFRSLESPPKGSWLDYENCDMDFIDVREHLKYLKYGYGRATDQLNIALRNGVISRESALEIAKEIDGDVSSESIKKFCAYIGVPENNFYEVRDSFVNTDIFSRKDENNWELINERV